MCPRVLMSPCTGGTGYKDNPATRQCFPRTKLSTPSALYMNCIKENVHIRGLPYDIRKNFGSKSIFSMTKECLLSGFYCVL